MRKPIIDIDAGYVLLGLGEDSYRESLRQFAGGGKPSAREWGEVITRSNAEQSEQLEKLYAQLQPNFE